MMTTELYSWHSTESRIGPLTFCTLSSELIFVIVVGAGIGGFMIGYGKYTHSLEVHGGWKGRALWRLATEAVCRAAVGVMDWWTGVRRK